ncbi:MAG: twin-arginine translocation signal domain-containing protein [Planctomycetes bacterium]|nr:twin-arginine translocation signal domain-containing protein [Planctomycetota bacterium]
MKRNASRREFLRNSSMAGVGMWIGSTVVGAPRSPAEKLNVACVGVGGKGSSDMGACRGENIVAICDTDKNRLTQAGSSSR